MFQDFNPGKFIVWVCLAVFTTLLGLKLDDEIDWSFWVVFIPIWIWKGLMLVGALIGILVWWKNPHYRLEGQSFVQYRALLISLSLHILLLVFELLLADNLENNNHSWVLVFIPLVLISTASIGACIWAVKHDRSFELELFCSVNLLQFIFIALRLDGHFSWPWEIVFVPAWILLCVCIIAVLYSVIYAILLIRMVEINPERKRSSLNSAIEYTCLVIPLVIFLVQLCNKLNGFSYSSYSSIFAPLNISFITLIFMSFSTKRANQWWFGLRKDLCQFLLGVCPLLQEYANVSYSFSNNNETTNNPDSETNSNQDKTDANTKNSKLDQRAVVPPTVLDIPD